MRYVVSDTFYNTVSSLIGIALEDGSALEFELAFDLIRDLDITEVDVDA